MDLWRIDLKIKVGIYVICMSFQIPQWSEFMPGKFHSTLKMEKSCLYKKWSWVNNCKNDAKFNMTFFLSLRKLGIGINLGFQLFKRLQYVFFNSFRVLCNVVRMSSPLKTPKLDTWGHPPTPSCLHPIAYIAYSPSCACATRVYCLQLKSFQGTFLCKCCFCTIFETLVLSYTSVVWTASWSTFWF